MADQPYQFGDVVDGYRWTITGWEPVEAPERTVGVPRLLEKRYAATQARQQAQTQTLDDPAPVVVADEPTVVPEPEPELDAPTAVAQVEPEPEAATSAVGLEEILGRTVVAAPDLAVTFEPSESPAYDEPPAFSDHVDSVAEGDADTDTEAHVALEADVDSSTETVPDDLADLAEVETRSAEERYDARPSSARAWYGLGFEPVDEPAEEPAPAEDPDAAFAAAMELGARTFAEHYQPSEIEIAAGIASGARRPADAWGAPAPVAPWAGVEEPSVAPEILDPHDAAYGAAAADGSDGSGDDGVEDRPEARPVTFSAPPPAGWYPGSA